MSELPVETVDENVDVPVDDESTDAPAEETPKEKKESKSKRPPVPSGFDTPINFAHALTARLQTEGKLEENEVFKPQVVYSYVKNKSKADPFPVYEVDKDGVEHEEHVDGVTRPLLKVVDGEFVEAMAWWDRKDERVAKRKENAKAKAQAKADKAAAKPAQTEAEGDAAPSEFAEVEEAE